VKRSAEKEESDGRKGRAAAEETINDVVGEW
jgi:hypothetical protein